MKGDEFYQLFKDALKFFGLDWGEQRKMQVSIKGASIVFSCGGATITYKLDEVAEL